MWRSEFEIKSDNYSQYSREIPTFAAYRAPNPGSLVDLNFDRKSQTQNAYICFGRGLNSLGLPLIIAPKLAYLAPILEANRIRFKIIDPETIEKPVTDKSPLKKDAVPRHFLENDEELSFLDRR